MRLASAVLSSTELMEIKEDHCSAVDAWGSLAHHVHTVLTEAEFTRYERLPTLEPGTRLHGW